MTADLLVPLRLDEGGYSAADIGVAFSVVRGASSSSRAPSRHDGRRAGRTLA